MKTVSKWEKRRKRLFHIIEVGSDFDEHSRWYDYENAAAIILNLAVTIMLTFENLRASYGTILEVICRLRCCSLFRIIASVCGQRPLPRVCRALLQGMTRQARQLRCQVEKCLPCGIC